MERYRNRHGHQVEQNFWDKIWRDADGKVVIWQFPNIPLGIWVVATILSFLFKGHVADFFSWIGSAGLIVWSLMEIFQGVNYLRRGLGIIVLAFSIATVIKSF